MGKRRSTAPVVCPYCGKAARHLANSSPVYGGTDYGPVWVCWPCDAWVGCHKGGTGTTPLGRLADKELRRAKVAAHAAFDPLWRAKMRREGCSQGEARSAAYRWLSEQLGLPRKETHIGMFDVAMCARVVAACAPYQSKKRSSAA